MKKMNKFIYVLIAGFAFAFTSCDKAKEKVKVETNFDLSIPTVKLYVDTFSKMGTMNFDTVVIQSAIQQTLDDNHANFDDVESISLKSADITMVNPGTQNFNMLSKVYANLSATGLPETRVAFIDPVPSNVTQISLTSDGANLM